MNSPLNRAKFWAKTLLFKDELQFITTNFDSYYEKLMKVLDANNDTSTYLTPFLVTAVTVVL